MKDTFVGTFFKDIDKMLVKLYYLYRKSPLRLRELKTFGDMYERSILKPCKSYGTRWIVHKLKAMETVLQNYGVFMQHLESLAQTDSQALKKAELVGWPKKWMDAKYPIHLAIYLDVLTPLNVLSLGFQNEKHDPVSKIRRITKFNWSMAKFKILIDQSLDDNSQRLTHYTKLLKDMKLTENGDHIYQDLPLNRFDQGKSSDKHLYDEIITRLALSWNKD